MPTPSTGAISLNDIQTEFGGSAPTSINEYYAGGSLVYSGSQGINGAIPSSGQISFSQFRGTIKAGQQAYTSGGTYTWVAPTGVYNVSVVAVGASAGGGSVTASGGGGLGYLNNYSVTPGNSYSVVVGQGGAPPYPTFYTLSSQFVNSTTVRGGGGGECSRNSPGTYVGTGGGNGGLGGQGYIQRCGPICCWIVERGGGGGAGGYSGTGGAGAPGGCGQYGAGGGGGGGASFTCEGGGGGGVGILGQGPSGAGGSIFGGGYVGKGGSGGADGSFGSGGSYGGGAGIIFTEPAPSSKGGSGAVRIIWPGSTRTFPSTGTGNV